MKIIGLYRTENMSRPFLEVAVAYETLTKEINCNDWLYNILDLMGEIIIHKHEFTLESGVYADVLTKKVYGDEVMISRFKVMKDFDYESGGANFFVVKATCYERDYSVLHEDILQSISWLYIINSNEWKLAEMLKCVSADLPDKLFFYYPSSWIAKKISAQHDRLSHYIISREVKEITKTMMNIFFLLPDKDISAQSVCDGFFKRLDKANFENPPLLRVINSEVNKNISQLNIGEKSMNFEGCLHRATLYIYVGRVGALWFYAECIAPDKNGEFIDWAINKRALEIVVNSFNNEELL
ncbi:hypothetical protein [Rahnella laticis]|uniref:hypothetical protein n=1 Tax=Rahnella laticis TaxID=2787622 RepID=UPI0018A2A5FF|nr:hypothetical protein [Rahnella laticis]MBF7995135.1 hypothetical protein [Rahnella laticis]